MLTFLLIWFGKLFKHCHASCKAIKQIRRFKQEAHFLFTTLFTVSFALKKYSFSQVTSGFEKYTTLFSIRHQRGRVVWFAVFMATRDR